VFFEGEGKMASQRVVIRLVCLMIVFGVNTAARGYTMQGLDITVDYWAGSGGNECIVVIDWNRTNGPYETESHAWGFRWEGSAYVSDALAAIDVAGDLDVTTLYGGAFIGDAFYYNPSVDNDNHTSDGFTGWWWAGETNNGGITWNGNDAGINTEILSNGRIEGLNLDNDNWTSSTLTIPVPEPCTLTILALGGLLLGKRRA
jgi:hypothetical protein